MKKILLFLVIFLLLFSSCQSEIKNYTDKSSQTFEYYTGDITVCIDWEIEPDPITEYYDFTYNQFAILQLGEIITEDDGKTLRIFANNSIPHKQNYFAVPIKIIKIFDSTTFSDENGNPCFVSVLQNRIYRDSNVSYFLQCLIQSENFLLPEGYDDLLLIPTDFVNSIEKGKTYLTCIDTLPVDYPMIDKVDSVYKEYPYANAIYMYGIGEMKEIPFMLPMTNNKLCMVDELEERFKTTNSYLTKLGLTDNLFRDGMTVDELEKYFDLVTDKNTFAPLFD